MDIERIVGILGNLLPEKTALHEPHFAGNEAAYVTQCIEKGWVSTAGAFVGRFEEMLKEITGARHVIATNTGTAALHAALLVSGIGPGDEVIVPSLTFVATANAIAHCGAVPHFADIEDRTLGLDPARLREYLDGILDIGGDAPVNRRTGRPVRAIVCVHVFGHPARVDELATVAESFGVALIEDAAESLGSSYKGRHTGTFGRIGTLSFNGNKTVTTGAGGAVLAQTDEDAATLRHLTTTAKRPHAWAYDHDMVGYNYRLPNLNAALGCAQLEQLDSFLERKRYLANAYVRNFAGIEGVRMLQEPADARSNYWLNALILDTPDAATLDALLQATNDAGVGTRPAWRPMHLLPMFENCPRMDLGRTEAIADSTVNLPSGPGLNVEAAYA